MRVTKDELRRVIREAVRRKLDEAESVDDVSPIASAIATAVVDLLDYHRDEMIERVLGDLGSNIEALPLPARREDVDGLSKSVASKVASSKAVYFHLERAAYAVVSALLSELDR